MRGRRSCERELKDWMWGDDEKALLPLPGCCFKLHVCLRQMITEPQYIYFHLLLLFLLPLPFLMPCLEIFFFFCYK